MRSQHSRHHRPRGLIDIYLTRCRLGDKVVEVAAIILVLAELSLIPSIGLLKESCDTLVTMRATDRKDD